MKSSLIINSPYTAPSQHWKFVEEGQSLELVEGRREAGYMVADPTARPHQDRGIFVPLPFEPGKHNRIAVKIVDNRGIESLRVVGIDSTDNT